MSVTTVAQSLGVFGLGRYVARVKYHLVRSAALLASDLKMAQAESWGHIWKGREVLSV